MELPKLVAAGIYDSRIAAKNVAISKNRKTTMFEIEIPIESGGFSYINSIIFKRALRQPEAISDGVSALSANTQASYIALYLVLFRIKSN